MMKKIFLFPVLLLLLSACNKKEVAAPGFGVTTEKNVTTFKAGDEVNFLFSGNPDYITFYSGEAGHMYEFRDRVTATARTDVGVPVKNMTTRVTSYSYTFAAAGTYKVTFDASNTSIYGSKPDVKEIDITIEP